MFFASKNNLKKRIESVLVNQSSNHNQIGSLTPAEATEFKKFLDTFYGYTADCDDKTKESFLSKVFKIFKKEEADEEKGKEEEQGCVEYREFACQAASNLEDSTFVKFE